MSSGYTSINRRGDDEDDDDDDKMFRNESSVYDHKTGGGAMFSDDGDAGTPHTFQMHSTKNKPTQQNAVVVPQPSVSPANSSTGA